MKKGLSGTRKVFPKQQRWELEHITRWGYEVFARIVRRFFREVYKAKKYGRKTKTGKIIYRHGGGRSRGRHRKTFL